jgi:hypothetical protein
MGRDCSTHREKRNADKILVGKLEEKRPLGSPRHKQEVSIVTCLLKARIPESGKTSVAKKWLCKHVSTATKPRDRRNRYTRKNKGTVGGGVFFLYLGYISLWSLQKVWTRRSRSTVVG